MITLGVDVGKHEIGVGLARDKTLIAGALLRRGHETGPDRLSVRVLDWLIAKLNTPGMPPLTSGAVSLRVIIEYPQAYRPGQQEGRQQDVVDLALVSGCVAGLIRSRFDNALIEIILPRTWKGTVDGDVMTRRIENRLLPHEAACLEPCPASLRHNMIDGVGIALWGADRLDRIRVYE